MDVLELDLVPLRCQLNHSVGAHVLKRILEGVYHGVHLLGFVSK